MQLKMEEEIVRIYYPDVLVLRKSKENVQSPSNFFMLRASKDDSSVAKGESCIEASVN